MAEEIAFVAMGAALGFLSGLFGVGGSSIATPALRLLGVPHLVALATPLPVTLPTAAVGALTYWRRGFVNPRVALLTALGGLPGVIAGSYLTTDVPGRVLMALTGLFVLAVGVRVLGRPLVTENGGSPRSRSVGRFLAVGLGVGFLSGLLANGGGLLLVPANLLLFQLDTNTAAATSLVTVALLAIPGTYVHWRLHHIDPVLGAMLAAGVVPFTYVGARVGLALDARRSRLLFGWFLLVFGSLFLLRTLYRAEIYGWSGR